METVNTMVFGMVPVYKPAGPTSAAMVGKIRQLTKIRRVGHAGTLDPAAEGVLVVALNRATAMIPYLPQEKSYHATIQLGITTDTLDGEGAVLETRPVPLLTPQALEEALHSFVGTIQQKPPMVSARHYQGQRLYELARQGKTVDIPLTTITIHAIHNIRYEQSLVEFDIDCSRGTYIRCIARDLGEKLGCGAHLKHLKRTRCSGFHAEQSVTLDELETGMQQGSLHKIVAPPARVLQHLPEVVLDEREQAAVRHGQQIDLPSQASIKEDVFYRLMDYEGRLLAIACKNALQLKMARVFYPAQEEAA